jgi:hypothetical protein
MTTLASTDSALIGALYHKPASPERRLAQAPADTGIETRLWKIASDTLRNESRSGEGVLFLVLGFSAVVTTVPCFYELLRLLGSDSISQTMKLLLQ